MIAEQQHDLARDIALSTRRHYWQAMREVCADVRSASPSLPDIWFNARWRTLAHYYEQYSNARDALRAMDAPEMREAA